MATGENGARRVALGMSGGVDSAVSAALLMRAGYEVVGVTCRFTDDAAADRAVGDAAAVCARLGLRHVEWDCAALFESAVVQPFVDAYAAGLTPSPCVGCNACCKLPSLLAAADELGCESVATGHYARIAQLADSGRYVVKCALDARKDQSYMLALLSQEQLARLVLPLGGTTKAEVRVLAADLGLTVAEKPESQDVCFIEGDYRAFLRARGVDDRPGTIVDCAGAVLGRHDDEARISSVLTGPVRWQALACLDGPRAASVKLRYRSRAVPCIIEPEPEGRVRAVLREPQPTTAPGQFAVFSVGDTVLGGGMIEEVASV